MAALTPEQITAIRRAIRDEWRDGIGQYKGRSDYNIARGCEFFTDPDINAIDAEILDDYALALDEVEQNAKVDEVIHSGDDSAAAAFGTSQREKGRFHLIAAECLRRMARDPTFRRAFVIGKGQTADDVFGGIEKEARFHFAWVFNRGDGMEVER